MKKKSRISELLMGSHRYIYNIYCIKMCVITALCCAISLSLAGCGGSADKLYDKGVEQFETGDYEAASKSFSEAIESNPEKAEYYIGYGLSLVGMDEQEEARAQFEKAIMDTDNRIVRENNKRAYRGIALSFYKEGNYEQAKGYLELALKTKELESLDTDLMSYMANCELYLGDYDKAVDYWNKLIDQGGSGSVMAGYYLGRGKTHSILGNHSEAIADYQNAIKESSDNYDAYIGLYSELKGTLDENGASKTLEEAAEKAGKSDDDMFYQGVFKYYQGEIDEALELFEKALEAGNNDAIYYKGRISQDKNDYEGAIKLYSDYLLKKPSGKNAEFCNQLGGCLAELGRYDEALTYFEQGVKAAAGDVKRKLVYNQIIAYEHTGDFKTAKLIAGEYLKDNADENMQKEYEFIKTRARDEDDKNASDKKTSDKKEAEKADNN